jgi:hypothetical protein
MIRIVKEILKLVSSKDDFMQDFVSLGCSSEQVDGLLL